MHVKTMCMSGWGTHGCQWQALSLQACVGWGRMACSCTLVAAWLSDVWLVAVPVAACTSGWGMAASGTLLSVACELHPAAVPLAAGMCGWGAPGLKLHSRGSMARLRVHGVQLLSLVFDQLQAGTVG